MLSTSTGALKVEYEVKVDKAKSDEIATAMKDTKKLESVGANVVTAVKADETLKNDAQFGDFAVSGVTAKVADPVAVKETATTKAPVATATEESGAISSISGSLSVMIACVFGGLLMV